MIHEFLLCTISNFWRIFDLSSTTIRRERKFQYSMPIPNNILVTINQEDERREKRDSKEERNIRCVCSFNTIFKRKL
jgi:hypothetical protein